MDDQAHPMPAAPPPQSSTMFIMFYLFTSITSLFLSAAWTVSTIILKSDREARGFISKIRGESSRWYRESKMVRACLSSAVPSATSTHFGHEYFHQQKSYGSFDSGKIWFSYVVDTRCLNEKVSRTLNKNENVAVPNECITLSVVPPHIKLYVELMYPTY